MRSLIRATSSIRARLLLTYIGIIVIGFSALTLFSGSQITAAVRADYDQRLINEIRIVAQAIGPSIASYSTGDLDDAQLVSAFQNYENQISGKLLFYPMFGRVFSRQSFFNKLELETAIRGGIVVVERKNDDNVNMLYTAAPVFINDEPRGVIQLAVPAENLQDVVLQRWLIILLGFVALTSVALLAALWLSQTIIQPLFKLRESAVRLSQGDLSHRITYNWQDEIGEVAGAFNNMAQQVQSMLEEQRAFASNTSHELRTPLTTIRLRTEALRYDPTLDSATAKQYIEEIDDEIVRLGNLLQDLTLLSRFDAGRAELGHDQIDFGRLATSISQQLAAQARDKDVRIQLDLREEPVQVTASLNHLTVVFRNLLDNALKYNVPGGTIEWQISQQNNGVRHIIRDTGQGISPEHLPHVFERFYRADRAHSRDIPGTGLGLALVKSIIEAYGGTITVQSEGAGKGTTVTVLWPCQPTASNMI